MTTYVTITNTSGSNDVKVQRRHIHANELPFETILREGEDTSLYVYDGIVIKVSEVKTADMEPREEAEEADLPDAA